MWHLLVLNFVFDLYPVVVKSAWVEIPQLPDKKPPQFVFGAPKVSFPEQKFPTATPTNHKIVTTTPKLPVTTLASYRHVMTTPTISPLTTTSPTPRLEERADNEVEETPTASTGEIAEQYSPPEGENKTEETNYSGFLHLLHSIQQTLTLNAKKSLKNKISLLTNLRDTLLANIDDRMGSLWQRSEDVSEARGHDDHEMEFPSNEGALMTIGFLTFAVFLIKLVLKLIHALKDKQNGQMMMDMGTMNQAATFIGRRKRDLEDYDSVRILQLIDEYKFS